MFRSRRRGRGFGVASAAWYTLGKADNTDPTFWADFINDRYAVDSVEYPFSDMFAFTRSTTGTYFDANGVMQAAAIDTPRFDHDPVTGQSLGILMEQQSTNLHTYSADLTSWSLGSGAVISANGAVAPDGTMTADAIMDIAGSGAHRASSGFYTTKATKYTLSFWIKDNGRRYFNVRTDLQGIALQNIGLDLTAGTVTRTPSGWTVSMVAQANGWYKVVASTTVTTAGSGKTMYFSLAAVPVVDDSYYNGYAATGGQGVYVWGVQLENLGIATSYIPTTSAAVTRGQETCVQSASTTVKVTDWFTSASMTLVTDVSAIVSGVYRKPFTLSGGSGVVRNAINSGDTSFFECATVDVSPDTNPSCVGVISYKQALAIATNDATCAVQGYIDSTPDASVTIPSGQNTLHVGTRESSGYGWETMNGHVRSFRHYPIRVSDSELQRITS